MDILLICLAFLAVTGMFLFLPTSYADWIVHLRQAALIGWQDVDTIYVYNPPWTLLPLYPLALLPPRLGASLLGALTLGGLAVYLRSPKKLLAVAASAPLIVTIAYGNIDILSVIGLLVPGSLGLPLLLIKPQGVLLAILPRLNRRSLLLTGLIVGLSLVIWGPTWLTPTLPGDWGPVNLSLFPYSIPLALPLTYFGIKRKSDGLLCLASLCISPYWMIISCLPTVAACIKESDDWRVWLAIIASSWAGYELLYLF